MPGRPEAGDGRPVGQAAAPWYREGLRFSCLACGACCTGGPGYVWVSDEEIERIAAFLGLERAVFRRRYLVLGYRGYSLREKAGYDCVFLDGGRCTIYPVRPRQCRSFPFWPETLRSRADWERFARDCPGMNHGRLYSLEEIREVLEGRKDVVR